MVDNLADRISSLWEKINAACLRSGRNQNDVQLMAVSKFQSLSLVEEAWKGGIRLFGESRVQEGIMKFAKFREQYAGSKIHFVGSLQRNKAKKAAEFFDCIQSVDREPLIDELGALTLGREQPLMILLEYHTGEAGKAGFPDLDSLYRAAEKVLSFPVLVPMGLMTIAPFSTDEKAVRTAFRSCRMAAEELRKRFPGETLPLGKAWSCISMGMSGDFEIAIEEGSTLVRIGTTIFGERH